MLVLGNGNFVFPLWVWPCFQRCEDFFRFKKARGGEQNPKGFEVLLTEGIGMQKISLVFLGSLKFYLKHDNHWDGGGKQDEKKPSFRILGDHLFRLLWLLQFLHAPI